jgi:hypothetical protein
MKRDEEAAVPSIEQWMEQIPAFEPRGPSPLPHPTGSGSTIQPPYVQPRQPRDRAITVPNRAYWTPNMDRTLLEQYCAQRREGINKAARVSQSAWIPIRKAIANRHRQWLDRSKVKSRLYVLRRRWRAWVSLVAAVAESEPSAARYDRTNRMVRATDVWWERYLRLDVRILLLLIASPSDVSLVPVF